MLDAINRTLAYWQFNTFSSQRIRVYKQINRLIKNSIPITQALDEIYNRFSRDGRKPDDSRAVMLMEWIREYRNHSSFARSVAGWIPDNELMLIESGEAADRLPEALDQVIFLATSGARMRSAFLSGISYPAILFLALVFLLITVATRIVPTFGSLVPIEHWTGMAGVLGTISLFVQNYFYPSLIILAVLTVAFVWSLPRWSGRTRAIVDQYQPYSTYRMLQGVSFLLAISAMMRSGNSVTSALERMIRLANPWLRQRLRATLAAYNNDSNLGRALYNNGYNFPDPELAADIRIYSGRTGFEDEIQELANQWVVEGVEKVNTITAVVRFAMIASIAGFIIVVITGVFELQSLLGDAATRPPIR